MADRLIPIAHLHSGEKEMVSESAREFDTILSGIQEIIQTENPDSWLVKTTTYLKRTTRNVGTGTPLFDFFKKYGPDVLGLIRDCRVATDVGIENEEERIALGAERLLVDIRSLIEFNESEPLPMHRMNWSEILERSAGRVRLETKGAERIVTITSTTGARYEFPVPTRDALAHKGGVCRLLLKIASNAPADLIEAELPLNDFDVVGAIEDPQVREEAIRLGLTAEGIEPASQELNYAELAAGRDVDLNQVFLDTHGLIFSDAARAACVSGEIHIPTPDKGMYNSATIPIEGGSLVNEWGMQRLMKFVVEGKAHSFSFTPLNRHIDMGPFLLTLAHKFANRPNKDDLLARMFLVAEQMGQVRDGEHTLDDVLERVRAAHPSVTTKKSEREYAHLSFVRWYAPRVLRSISRAFRNETGALSTLPLARKTDDMIPYTILLPGLPRKQE